MTCASANATCGPIGDGCGGILNCGSCTLPETCGGGGVASQCGGSMGCFPRDCTTIGANCTIYPFASLGTPPQSLSYRGEMTRLQVG